MNKIASWHHSPLALAALLFFFNLSYAPVWNPDEARYVAASLEMMSPLDNSAPNWIVPHLNTLPRLNKPPLVYWCAASLFKIFGPSAWAARLVPALAALGVLLILWRMGAAMFDEKTGVLAAVVWATCALPFCLARMLSTDMLLAFSFSLALLGFYKFLSPRAQSDAKNETQKSTVHFPSLIVAGLGLGLALLAKGPVGVALPLLIAFAWMLLVAPRRIFRAPVVSGVFVSLFIACLLAAPWYLAIARAHPEFLSRFLWGENIARLTGGTVYHKPKPFWFYAPIIAVGLLPWTAFLWPAACAFFDDFKTRLSENQTGTEARARLFLWLWAFAIIALFSISKTKLIPYILPALPPLALLIAQVFSKHNAPNLKIQSALRSANSLTIGICILLSAAVPLAFYHPKILADKIVPRQVAAPWVWASSAVFILGALVLWRRRRAWSTLPFLGGAAFLLLAAFAGRFAVYEEPSPMLEKLQPFLRPGDRIVQFKTFQPSALFYARRPSTVVDFVNTSGLDEEEFATSGRFVQSHDALQKLAAGKNRIFVLTRWKHAHWPTFPKMFLIAANNDYRLYSNRPAPAGFEYDFIAPRKRDRELSPACKNLAAEC